MKRKVPSLQLQINRIQHPCRRLSNCHISQERRLLLPLTPVHESKYYLLELEVSNFFCIFSSCRNHHIILFQPFLSTIQCAIRQNESRKMDHPVISREIQNPHLKTFNLSVNPPSETSPPLHPPPPSPLSSKNTIRSKPTNNSSPR